MQRYVTKYSMSKLLIVGTVAFDAIETPFGKTDKILGGAATYIALAASQFNVESGIVSVVGGDFPKSFLQKLNDKKIDTTGIEIVEKGKSFFWSGKYHNDLNVRDTLTTELNVLADFKPSACSFSKPRFFNVRQFTSNRANGSHSTNSKKT